MRSSNTDLKSGEKKGLLWILDEESMFPGASEDSFMERFFVQHGEQQVRSEYLGLLSEDEVYRSKKSGNSYSIM